MFPFTPAGSSPLMDSPMNGVADPDMPSAIRSVGHAVDNAADRVEKTAAFGINNSIVRTIMQGGFALLVGYLFYDIMQTNKAERIEDRTMYREEAREQRTKSWENTKMLRESMDGVKKAVEVNTAAVEKTGVEHNASHKAVMEEIRKLVKENQQENP